MDGESGFSGDMRTPASYQAPGTPPHLFQKKGNTMSKGFLFGLLALLLLAAGCSAPAVSPDAAVDAVPVADTPAITVFKSPT